jgi:hypothetical protein
MATPNKEEFKMPNNTIEYSRRGRVVKVTDYCNVNNQTASLVSYERKGTKFYQTIFDEHHAVYEFDKQVEFAKLPESVQAIFRIGTRKRMTELRVGLASYVDKEFKAVK